MAKRTIVFKKGRFYHIYNRGANRNKIFYEKGNYYYLLRKLKEYSEKYFFTVPAYCLMPNHYHFLLSQSGEYPLNISIGYIFNGYTKAINKKYNRTGTLFEGEFKCIEIEEEKYLLGLCRYIHRNPIDDRLVKNIQDWPFSNYLEWVNKRKGTLFNLEFRNKYFPNGEGYEMFVLDYYSNKQFKNELREYLKEMKKKSDKSK